MRVLIVISACLAIAAIVAFVQYFAWRRDPIDGLPPLPDEWSPDE